MLLPHTNCCALISDTAGRYEASDEIAQPERHWEVVSDQIITAIGPEIAHNRALWMVVNALNSLGVLYCQQGSYVQAVLSLHIAEQLYIMQRESIDCNEPRCEPLEKILCSTANAKSLSHTHTLFFLAQVYGHLSNSAQAAR